MLKGKNAIVTGSNRGIGKAVVEEFARCGCNIWACARRENQEFEEHIAQLAEKCGVWIKPVYFDLSSEDAVKDGFKQIYREKLPVDILVNNAALGYSGLFSLTSMKTVRELYETNVFAVFTLTQLVLKLIRRSRKCFLGCGAGGTSWGLGIWHIKSGCSVIYPHFGGRNGGAWDPRERGSTWAHGNRDGKSL